MDDEAQLIKALQGVDTEYDRAVLQLCESKELKQSVGAMVRKLGGNEADVEDIFWESIGIVIFNITKGRFREESSVKTYLGAIARNVFLKQRKPVSYVEESQLSSLMEHTPSPEAIQVEKDREEQLVLLYQQLVDKVEAKCKKIFEMYHRGASMKAIAEEMGYEQVQSAQNAKYRCQEKLRQMIMDDSNLRRQIGELL